MIGRTTTALFAVATACAALAAAYTHGHRTAQTACQAQTLRTQAEAAQLLATLTNQARQTEQAQTQKLADQNTQDARHAQTISDLSRRLDAVRMRDPNAIGCSGASPSSDPSTPAHTGDADPTQAAGLLSAPLERLLRHLTSEADAINLAYASCRAVIVD